MNNFSSLKIAIPTIGRIDYLDKAISSARIFKEKYNAKLQIYNFSEAELKYPNIDVKQVKIDNNSLSKSWNEILHNTEEEWLLLLHDDDELIPSNFLSLDLTKYTNVGAIVGNYNLIDSEGYKFSQSNYNSLGKYISIKNTPKFCSTIYNVKKLKAINGWMDIGHALDLICLLELELKYGFHIHDQVLGKYRIHSSQEMQKSWENYQENHLKVKKEIHKITSKKDVIELYESSHMRLTHEMSSKKTFINRLKIFAKKLFYLFFN